MGTAGARRVGRGGNGVRGRRSSARARRLGVRARGERDSRMAGAAAGDGRGRGRGDRGAAGDDRPRTKGHSGVDSMTPTGGVVTNVDVGAAAQLACLLEVSAPKPGNVSPVFGFAD